jgi:hypothetical protein
MKNGLKGVTDATVFCKSMKKGNDNNQIIRSMKSYNVGGVTGLQSPNAVAAETESECWPGKPGCAQSNQAKRRRARSTQRRINQNKSRF